MKLHHAALVCRSQENADRFYEGILNLQKVKTALLKSDLAMRLFGVDVPCPLILYGNEELAIEIFVTDRIPSGGSPVSHLCIQVEDREAFLGVCRSAGVAINIVPKGEAQVCFVEDFDGNLFEIKQALDQYLQVP